MITYKIGEICTHENTTTETTDATCVDDGLTTVTCNDCGTTTETPIPATGEHTYVEGACDVCGKAEDAPELTEKTYSYTFVSGAANSNGNKTLGGVVWNVNSTGTYFGNIDSSKGQQYGSGNNPTPSLTFTSAPFNNVSKIVINTSGAKSVASRLVVKVNGVQVGDAISLTNTATNYTFTLDEPATGTIEICYTTTAKAIYVKSITVVYAE